MMVDWKFRARPVMTAVMIVASTMAVTGCKKTTGGQVAAVVNDEEVTQREVRAEMTPADQQGGRDPKAAARAVLDRVIDRNLLAQYARDQGLDRDPEYVTRRRQLEQALLATMAMRKVAGPAAAPSQAEAQAFIVRNPFLFEQRQQLTLDQVRIASPDPVTKVDAYSRLGSIDAIIATLKAQKVPFTRSRQQLDTGGVSNEFAAQILKLKAGEPFAVSTDGTTYISVIVGRAPATTARETWLQAATDAVRQQKGTALLNDQIAKLRKAAEIVYDPAFTGPAAAAPTSGAKADVRP